MELDTIDRLGQVYFREANGCAKDKLYLASCILYGAALEAVLPENCYGYIEKVQQTNICRSGKIRNEKDFLKLDLNNLIEISYELRWLKNDELYDRNGNLVEMRALMGLVKEIRNLIHPGKWCRDYKNIDIAEEHYKDVSLIMNLVIKKLLHRGADDGFPVLKKAGTGS